MNAADKLFWQLAAELQKRDPRVVEGPIMNGRCLRVGTEFLALVDYKGAGLVVKLPRARVEELIATGVGVPGGPTRMFQASRSDDQTAFSSSAALPEIARRL